MDEPTARTDLGRLARTTSRALLDATHAARREYRLAQQSRAQTQRAQAAPTPQAAPHSRARTTARAGSARLIRLGFLASLPATPIALLNPGALFGHANWIEWLTSHAAQPSYSWEHCWHETGSTHETDSSNSTNADHRREAGPATSSTPPSNSSASPGSHSASSRSYAAAPASTDNRSRRPATRYLSPLTSSDIGPELMGSSRQSRWATATARTATCGARQP